MHSIISAIGINNFYKASVSDSHLWLDVVEFAVLKPPQHVLRLVVCDGEVEAVKRNQKLLPNLQQSSFTFLRARVKESDTGVMKLLDLVPTVE